MTIKTITEADIAKAAFYIWLDEGQPSGRDQEHWHQAAERLKADAPVKPKRRAAAKPRAAKLKTAAAAKAQTAKPRAGRAAKPAS